jgi:hypothetical protein
MRHDTWVETAKVTRVLCSQPRVSSCTMPREQEYLPIPRWGAPPRTGTGNQIPCVSTSVEPTMTCLVTNCEVKLPQGRPGLSSRLVTSGLSLQTRGSSERLRYRSTKLHDVTPKKKYRNRNFASYKGTKLNVRGSVPRSRSEGITFQETQNVIIRKSHDCKLFWPKLAVVFFNLLRRIQGIVI